MKFSFESETINVLTRKFQHFFPIDFLYTRKNFQLPFSRPHWLATIHFQLLSSDKFHLPDALWVTILETKVLRAKNIQQSFKTASLNTTSVEGNRLTSSASAELFFQQQLLGLYSKSSVIESVFKIFDYPSHLAA